MNLIGVLVALVIFVVIVYAVRLVLGTMALPSPFPELVYLVLFVIFLVVLLRLLGVWGGGVVVGP
jgi:hypothetical protein